MLAETHLDDRRSRDDHSSLVVQTMHTLDHNPFAPPATGVERTSIPATRETVSAKDHISFVAGTPSEIDPSKSDAQIKSVDLAPLIDTIVAEHMRRQAAIKAQRRLDQAMGAMARRLCGWRVDLDEKERTRLNKRAERIIKQLSTSVPVPDEDAEIAEQLMPFVAASLQGRQPFDMLRKNAEKAMAECARKLPVWPWVNAIRGVDAGGLAAIIGEAGNLSNYANPAKLWKRLGLAVIDGKRQGAPGAKAAAEEWIRHGYSGRRRSVMWNVGYALVMCNKDGRYRTMYLARKDYEKAREPEMSKGHANNRGQRYMEKAFVRDLWVAWRAASRVACDLAPTIACDLRPPAFASLTPPSAPFEESQCLP